MSIFTCLFFGDSLALGIAQAVNAEIARPCEVRAVSGAASHAMLGWQGVAGHYDTAILSIGSNDDLGSDRRTAGRTHLASEGARRRAEVLVRLGTLRRRLPCDRVIWVLPYNRARAILVHSIAAKFGDEVLEIRQFRTRDGVHPESYRSVAQSLLRNGRGG